MFMFDAYNIIILIKNIREYNRQMKEKNNKYEKLINSGYNK
jgi:hypothetical protein